ncbi:MAG: FAD-dependent oxidoreductase [Chloroflexota bacterium]|nr:FAD-dependent oxidoreductase [Chloroflexota bacterium]
MGRRILEPAREIQVRAEADVVVVGGGPAGLAAAVAAARNGASTVLVERYGHLGGMATGGLVTLYLHMSDGGEEQQIAGICQETVDRLDAVGGALHPPKGDLGSADEAVLRRWQRYYGAVIDGRLRLSVVVDPELLKCVFNDMAAEAGVKLLLHAWGSRALAADGAVQGVVLESKSGRQAVLGQVTVDATGDGDVLASAGAEFDGSFDQELRSSQLALVFRLERIDFEEFCEFRESQPQAYGELLRDLRGLTGFQIRPWVSFRQDTVWFNNWIPGLSAPAGRLR